jgi:hypothetical protein
MSPEVGMLQYEEMLAYLFSYLGLHILICYGTSEILFGYSPFAEYWNHLDYAATILQANLELSGSGSLSHFYQIEQYPL